MTSNTGFLDVDGFFGKYQHIEMLIAIQVFAIEIIFDRCVGINRVV